MAKFKFHKVAAIAVLIASAGWVLTGEFSSVGSAANGEASEAASPAQPGAEENGAPQAADAAAPVLKTVAVVKPLFIDHSRAIRISGQTKADKSATLATRTGGIIASLPVTQGQRVEEGDLILSLETEGKEAVVATAKAVLAQREKEFEASERLAAKGSLPKLQLDNVRSALASAKSSLEQAQADLDRLQIHAPFAGIIDRLDVELASSVGQGAQVALLLQLDPIIAAGEVSETDLLHVNVGDKARVRLVSGKEVDGTIRYISRQANPQTRTFPVEVAVPNATTAIPAGMTAEITLLAEPVRAVILPRSVVTLSRQGDLGIRIVGPEDIAAFVPIDLVDDTPNGLLLAGIPEDARVIVAGQDLVSEGDKVNAVEADAETVKRLIREATGATN
ncbi:MAG: efflux RND transporter periplasmic adaptor subunit [Notoacmeibacter sp.]|nr:efflux RND transporter periplasmic adaptor subunit [Notoacmeibacter sp.]